MIQCFRLKQRFLLEKQDVPEEAPMASVRSSYSMSVRKGTDPERLCGFWEREVHEIHRKVGS